MNRTLRGFLSSVALALFLALSVGAATATATNSSDRDTPRLSVELASYNSGVVTPEGNLRVSLRVSNNTDANISGALGNVAITRQQIGSRDLLRDYLTGEENLRTRNVYRSPIGEADPENPESTTLIFPANSSRVVTLDVPASDLLLSSQNSGVYGVIASVRHRGEVFALDPLVMTWLSAEQPQVNLAFVADVSGPGAANRVADALSIDATLVLDAAGLQGVELPREAGTTPVFYRSPAYVSDVASLAHGADSRVLEKSFALAKKSYLPGYFGKGVVAPIGAIDQSVINTLSAHQPYAALASLDATRTAVESGLISGAASRFAGSNGTVTVLTPDLELTSIITRGSLEFGLTNAAQSTLLADAALVALEAGGSANVVVALGEEWDPENQPGWRGLSTALLDAPFVNAVELHHFVNAAATATTTLPEIGSTSGDLPAPLVAHVSRTLDRHDVIARTLSEPSEELNDALDGLLRSVGRGNRTANESWPTTVTAAVAEIDGLTTRVSLTNSSVVNLISSSANLPVSVRNDFDSEVTVKVVVTSYSPNLRIVDEPVLVIPAKSERQALVPVEAVSNGNVAVSVAVVNMDDEIIAASQLSELRVRAEWGNIITLTFSIGLVALLLAGVYRTIRRGRKDTRTSLDEAQDIARKEAEDAHE